MIESVSRKTVVASSNETSWSLRLRSAFEHPLGFIAGKNHRQPLRSFAPDEIVEPWQVLPQHFPIQEKDAAESHYTSVRSPDANWFFRIPSQSSASRAPRERQPFSPRRPHRRLRQRLTHLTRLTSPVIAYTFAFFNRSAFPITDTELNVIAALAIMGFRSRPVTG